MTHGLLSNAFMKHDDTDDDLTINTSMLLPMLPAFAGPASAAPLQCNNASSWYTDRGMTHRGYTYVAAESAADCCSACASNASCVAWTFHASARSNGHCAVAPYATVIMGEDKVSGSKLPPQPGPPPPPPLPPMPPPHPPAPNTRQPNIVIVLQDDQDLYMGGYDGRGSGTPGPMRQATELLNKRGATAENWFIHTPVCCPSRAEFLSGKYLHNVRVGAADEGGCMHVDEEKVNTVSFAYYLQAAGYTSAYFGKHLNQCPPKPPPGFACPTCRWFAYGGDTAPGGRGGGYVDSAFFDYVGGVAAPTTDAYHEVAGIYKANHTWDEHAGYSASIVGNKSIEWVRKVAKLGKPWMVTIGNRASHAPFTPAPWYAEGSGRPQHGSTT